MNRAFRFNLVLVEVSIESIWPQFHTWHSVPLWCGHMPCRAAGRPVGTDRPLGLFYLLVLDKHCSTVVTTSTLLLKTFHGGFQLHSLRSQIRQSRVVHKRLASRLTSIHAFKNIDQNWFIVTSHRFCTFIGLLKYKRVCKDRNTDLKQRRR
jgi:hypothetical protein